MTYILFGPGVRNNVTINELVLRSDLPPVDASRPVDEVTHIEYEGVHNQGGQGGRAGRQAVRQYQELEESHVVPHQRHRAIHAEEIMSDHVHTLMESTPVTQIWSLFHELEIHHLPVLSDAENKLSGMVSDHDYLIKLYLEGQLSNIGQLQALDIMTSEVLAASEDTNIRELARVMFEHQIGAVPIVDKSDKLVGIVTRNDILKTLINEEPLELWI